MWETWLRFLGWEDPLEKGKVTHSSILAWRIPWIVQSMGLQRVGHNWTTFTSLHFTSLSSKEQVSFNFMAAVTVDSNLGAQENKICHCFHFPPSICCEVMGPFAMILIFWMLSFKPAFSHSSFTLIRWLFSSSSLSAVRVVSSAYLKFCCFSRLC